MPAIAMTTFCDTDDPVIVCISWSTTTTKQLLNKRTALYSFLLSKTSILMN